MPDPLPFRLTGAAEDFQVREIMHRPEKGTRLVWFQVRHRNIGTEALVKQLEKNLGIEPGNITWSGRKDRDAIAVQWLACPQDHFDKNAISQSCELLDFLSTDERLSLARHHKNEFQLRLVATAEPPPANQISAWRTLLLSEGFPNHFGQQRFPDIDRTMARANKLLQAPRGRMSRLQTFQLNAWQAWIFNQILDDWINRGKPETDTDFIWHPGAKTALPRLVGKAGAPAFPLFGSKTEIYTGDNGDAELRVLKDAGWDWKTFRQAAERLKLFGQRRPAMVIPEGLAVSLAGKHLLLKFELPAGSYATSLVAHLTS